jgi:hypothetical protein
MAAEIIDKTNYEARLMTVDQRTCRRPVSSADIAPTMVMLANAPLRPGSQNHGAEALG